MPLNSAPDRLGGHSVASGSGFSPPLNSEDPSSSSLDPGDTSSIFYSPGSRLHKRTTTTVNSKRKKKRRRRRDSWPPSRLTESVSGIFVNNNNNNEDDDLDEDDLVEALAQHDSVSILCCDESGLITLKEEDFNPLHTAKQTAANKIPVRVNPQETLLRLIQQQRNNSASAGDKVAAGSAAAVAAAAAAGEQLLRRKKIASIFQHYYPEGDWGYVILVVALAVQILVHGMQLGFGLLLTAMPRRWTRHQEHFVTNSGKKDTFLS